LRGRKNITVHTDPEKFMKHAAMKRCSDTDVHHWCSEDGTFLGVTAGQKTKAVVLSTPRMVGWAVLEYAKLTMLEFHYGVMKKLFPKDEFGKDRLKLLYTDTDSLYYEIRWPEDPCDYIAESDQKDKFDLSLCERYKDWPQAGKLGSFKYEGADNKDGVKDRDNEIVKAVLLAAKNYAKEMKLKKKGSQLVIAGKGVPGAVLKEKFGDGIENFDYPIMANKVKTVTFNTMVRTKDGIKHCATTKTALSGENDKVFQVSPYESLLLGHRLNKEPAPPCEEWDLEDDDYDEVLAEARQLIANRTAPAAAPLQEEEEEDSDYEPDEDYDSELDDVDDGED
jgi:hypothetical protein